MTSYTVGMSRRLGVGACVAILAIARATRAQEGPEALTIAYDAPEGCPTSEAFFREISARTTRARAARPNESARVMHVVVTKRGEEHAGQLWIEDANASSTARSVSGRTCGEVVGALALIGAMAVDPRASTAPIPAAPMTADPAGGAGGAGVTAGSQPGASSINDAQRPTEKPATTSPPSPPGAASVRAPEAEPRASSPPRPRGRFEVGAQVEAAFFAGAVPSGRLFGDLSIGPRAGLFAPAIRIAVARSLDVDRAAAIGGAKLSWTAAGIDVCPIRIVVAGPLALRPCAGGSGGVLDASGTGIAGSVSRSRPWATLSALVRLVWEPMAWLDIELEAGVTAPLYRESFFFSPAVAVYEAPSAAFLSRGGFGIRFP